MQRMQFCDSNTNNQNIKWPLFFSFLRDIIFRFNISFYICDAWCHFGLSDYPFKIVIFIHYKPRIAVAILDL